MPIRLSVFGLLALSMAAVSADNWPEFRGPHGDGHSDATGLPTVWSEAQHVRWKTAIHDKGWSSPVVWGNQVWVTTATEAGDKCYAVGIDRETGKVVHDVLLFEVKLAPRPAKKNPPSVMATYEEWAGYNSYASPTPAVEEGRVYAHFGSTGTACLDTSTGQVLWKRTDLKCGHHRGPGSSPILYDNLLILTFDGSTFNTSWPSTRRPARPSGSGTATSSRRRTTGTPRRGTARRRSSRSRASRS